MVRRCDGGREGGEKLVKGCDLGFELFVSDLS